MRYGKEINEISKVVKINQKDHAQGHICPNCVTWLKLGPTGLQKQAREKLNSCSEEQKNFYESVILVMEGVRSFMLRYHDLMMGKFSEEQDDEAKKESMIRVVKNCKKLSQHPGQRLFMKRYSLYEFLFVVLQMESNASSFSPGRRDCHRSLTMKMT